MISQPLSTQVFRCSICDEPSLRICFCCTKDTCDNHLCQKCRRCSDCCSCEVPLDEARPRAEEPSAPAGNGSEPEEASTPEASAEEPASETATAPPVDEDPPTPPEPSASTESL